MIALGVLALCAVSYFLGWQQRDWQAEQAEWVVEEQREAERDRLRREEDA